MTDLHRIQTHARSILEGEGQDSDRDLARDLLQAVLDNLAMDGIFPDQYRQSRIFEATLSTIRKHQESCHD